MLLSTLSIELNLLQNMWTNLMIISNKLNLAYDSLLKLIFYFHATKQENFDESYISVTNKQMIVGF